jgi:glycyl-tRNA synthetase beta chain
MPDLLLELFSEEIPARLQAKAADDLKRLVTQGMVDLGLTYEAAAAFTTPRRLALTISGLPKLTPDVREERKGPRVDAPEKALEGFLRSTGLSKDQLEARDSKKGQVWFAVIEKPGRSAVEVLAEVIPNVIRSFPWPRSMRWGVGDLRWVRPLQSILCILSDEAGREVVPFAVDHLTAGGSTRGHRFMGPDAFEPRDFDDYVAKLSAAKVVLDPAARRETIWADATNMAFAHGMEVVEDQGLLAEVAGLVEWPVVLMGDIEERFLALPPEVLQTSMKEHQKFFSVRNPKTGRIEKFVTVANIEAADNGATILAGNQRVLAARLSDALFFWENDLRVAQGDGLVAMAAPLSNVTFHNKLGSQSERISRIAALAREIAPSVGADPDLAEQAAKVAKADLCSEMVYEFPELQGTMGKYYAEAAGLAASVADACETHYSPLGPSDDVPTNPVAVAVSLADKIDTLTGFWAIDEKPTGSKDPFALRRAALGVIRLVLENNIRTKLQGGFTIAYLEHLIDFRPWENGPHIHVKGFKLGVDLWCTPGCLRNTGAVPFELARSLDDIYFSDPILLDTKPKAELVRGHRSISSSPPEKNTGLELPSLTGEPELLSFEIVVSGLLSFLADRLKVHLKAEGVRHDVIDACFQLGGQDDLVLLVNRINALQAFVETDDGANLLAGYKRASNILAAEQKKDGVEYTLDPDPKFAEHDEETAFFAALDLAAAAIEPALKAEDFGAAMIAMAALRAPIDGFFDKVIVNAENSIIRRNRLCMLNRVTKIMERVALFSAIEG